MPEISTARLIFAGLLIVLAVILLTTKNIRVASWLITLAVILAGLSALGIFPFNNM